MAFTDLAPALLTVTPQGELRACNVVVATGPYQRGRVPPLQRGLAPEVLQIHAGERAPRRYRGRDAFWWRRALGVLDQTAAEVPPERRLPPPLVTGVHGGYDVDLRQSAARGLSLLGHLQDISDGRLHFADDLETNLRAGDQSLEEFVSKIDAHVAHTGLDGSFANAA